MNFNFLNNMKFQTFEEFENFVKGLSTMKDRGDAFEEFAYLYFVYNKDIYDIKEIYSESEIPQVLKEKYKLELSDYGVDGLIITNNGESIAYQVKFRSDNTSATYSELATFWAESEYCDKRCIFSNCMQLPSQAQKKKNQFQILLDSFLSLDVDFFTSIYELANNIPLTKKQKYTPRDYQEVIINDVVNGFEVHNRGKIICACGTGKTLTAMWIKETLKSKKTLFVVPSLALVRQTLVEWKKQCNIPFSHLVVCSDQTINNLQDEITLEESSSSNIPVTTDANAVKDFLLNIDGDYVVFSTYQSLDCIMSALMMIPEFQFDLAFFDEAHRTAGTNDSAMFSIGLEDEYININKRLFMTATERVVTPRVKQLASEQDYTIFSMDDVNTYGPVFSRLDFGMAIEKNIINDYKVILSVINDSDIKNLLNEKSISSDGLTSLNTDITLKQLILAKAFSDLSVKKVITYHSTVKQAREFVYGSNSNYPFDAILDNVMNTDQISKYFSHVNGTMSSAVRTSIFDNFKKNSISIMSNASCLTEGVDIPIIDAVYFVEPKSSMINIIQAIGRALRKSPEKANEFSYIIIPVLIDDSINNFTQINPQKFDTLHMVIQALRDQDSRLAEEIDILNMSIATSKGGNHKPTTHVGVFIPNRLSLDDFCNSLSLRIADVNKNTDKNNAPSIKSVESRHSAFTRVFRTMGDYAIESYENSLVKPALDKFANENSIVLKQNLSSLNHNAVSHCIKIGFLNIDSRGFCTLTPIGKQYKNKSHSFVEIFKRQSLKYFEYNGNTTSVLFPYRSFFKVLKEFESISRLEFLYAIYTLKGSQNKDIEYSIEIIREIRESYPNINILSDENKKRVLSALNLKYGTEFNHSDVWTSRTTAYNQYNYFKAQIMAFDDILSGDSNSNVLIKQSNANERIDYYLNLDASIESMSVEELKKYYTQGI